MSAQPEIRRIRYNRDDLCRISAFDLEKGLRISVPCAVEEQGMSLALALAQMVLDGCGAWRVHGGGFGGTTQNFVPLDKLDVFKATMEQVFGEGSCHVLNIRPYGGVSVDALAAE